MKVICIIPAREKSRRLRNKNILKIKNKMLFQITLNKSIKIKEFDKIIVSTDSENIRMLYLLNGQKNFQHQNLIWVQSFPM